MKANALPTNAARATLPGPGKSLSAEQVLQLVRRAQRGDVPAEHTLFDLSAPLRGGVRARYQLAASLQEEWAGQLYLVFHRLLMAFEPERGIGFFTFLAHTLPSAVWSWVRQQQARMVREGPVSGLVVPRSDADPCSQAEAAEKFLEAIEQTCAWQSQERAVEDLVVARLALAAALDTLPRAQREVLARWVEGYTCEEIAHQLGMNVEACYKSLQRSRVRLCRALDENS